MLVTLSYPSKYRLSVNASATNSLGYYQNLLDYICNYTQFTSTSVEFLCYVL